jgi:hypothetical protein
VARFRRLCVDLDAWNVVVGASVEFYDDTELKAQAVTVCAPMELAGRGRHEMLEYLEMLGWYQPGLPFPISELEVF